MDLHRRCDMACEILRATNNGDDLAPEHLWLVQEAVNGHLDKNGYQLFQELHQQEKSGSYEKPWLFAIENLTRDHECFVYWKGKHVEHYTLYSASDWEKLKVEAQELARRCLLLKKHGIEPSVITAIWQWEEKYAHLS